MALSTTGYTASGAGSTAANGNYVPVTGANATYNSATQYTNGTDFLAFNGTSSWIVANAVNFAGVPLYFAAGSTTTFPLSGWSANVAAPAPTFAAMSGGGGGGAVVTRCPPIFF